MRRGTTATVPDPETLAARARRLAARAVRTRDAEDRRAATWGAWEAVAAAGQIAGLGVGHGIVGTMGDYRVSLAMLEEAAGVHGLRAALEFARLLNFDRVVTKWHGDQDAALIAMTDAVLEMAVATKAAVARSGGRAHAKREHERNPSRHAPYSTKSTLRLVLHIPTWVDQVDDCALRFGAEDAYERRALTNACGIAKTPIAKRYLAAARRAMTRLQDHDRSVPVRIRAGNHAARWFDLARIARVLA